MFEFTLSELKNYLLQHPELENDLPESYVQGLKNFNVEHIETIKSLVEALFNETYEDEEGSLVFRNTERYSVEPQFAPNCYYLLQDNNTYRLLALCYEYFPTNFPDYILSIVTHPNMHQIIGEAHEKAQKNEFIGENALSIWHEFIDHQREEKTHQILIDVMNTFLEKKESLPHLDIKPIPLYEVDGILNCMLEREQIQHLFHFLSLKEMQVFLSILMALDDIHFFADEIDATKFIRFIEKTNLDGIACLNQFIEVIHPETSAIVMHQALILLLDRPSVYTSVVNIYNHLHFLGLFDEHHLNSLKEITSFSTLADLLNMLSTVGLIDTDNAGFLYSQFLPLLNRFAQSQAIELLLFAIGHEHDFQAHEWQEIINMVEMGSPETELHAYVINLLEQDQVIGLEIFPDDITIIENQFNGRQSTHTASVHKTVSNSAIRLKASYGTNLNETDIIKQMRDYFEGLEKHKVKYMVACRVFNLIISGDYAYFDKTSKTSLLELLILTWLAIADDKKRIGHKVDVMELWLQGLYEIEKDSDSFEHSSDPEHPICGGGGFNKLIQSLVGAHELVEVQYLTMISLSYKLKATVQYLVLNYLKYFTNPLTLEAFFQFNQMINDIETHGIESYWPLIKKCLEIELYNEFASLFKSQNCDQFQSIIDSGEYVQIENLKRFQKDIAASKGYYQFCHASLFQRLPKIDKQHEFDKRYGLIITKLNLL